MDKIIDVVIPSATLVPEQLRNIGNFPGIIYPINQKIVFDYLYDQYKNISGNIDIICYQEKDKIYRRLSAYCDSKICIKDLDVLDDLGHTIYFALKDKKNTVIINFADTIIMDEEIPVDNDAIFYSEDYMSDVWTFFEIKNGIITAIYDKENIISNEKKKLFTGLFVIKDCELFCDCLEKAFNTKNDSMSTFYFALYMYSKLKKLTAIKVENWFDIGHVDTYYNSKLEVRAREFNHIEIDTNRGLLKKTSEDKEKFIGEILWYLKLPTDIEYVRPRIFGYSTTYDNPYIEMEYYAYHTIHELFLYSDLNYHQWNDIFRRIKFVINDFERYSVEDHEITSALEEIYLTKTLKRLEKLRNNVNFTSFFDNKIVINGIVNHSLSEIMDLLKKIIPQTLYDVKKFNIIHGDLCFA
ncbi:MAG: capsular biosynthesis protein, partial [Clostridia bacterium]|nr:capsular biosynthesis protein [Clostridia bacterium]